MFSFLSSFILQSLPLYISAIVSGAESISVYEDVLRSVRYRLAKGSARFERRFRLSCSEMNGRYTSNELTLEVRRTILTAPPLLSWSLISQVFGLLWNVPTGSSSLPGELPPLSRQPVPPISPASLPATVPPSIPSCRRAERTHFTEPTSQLR